MVAASEALTVEFTDRDSVMVISSEKDHTGAPLVGFSLDNWNNERAVGNRQGFSDWEDTQPSHAWQLNDDDGTISPLGDRWLVLGWTKDQLQLMTQDDRKRLQFDVAALKAAAPVAAPLADAAGEIEADDVEAGWRGQQKPLLGS